MNSEIAPGTQSQRRVPRRNYGGPVGVLAGGQYIIERATQVGEGGMMVSTERAFAAGDQMVMSFALADGAIIIVRAVVRNFQAPRRGPGIDEPARIGVEFVNLEFHYKRQIRNFVASATE